MPDTTIKEAKAVIFSFIFTPIKKKDKDARSFHPNLRKISQFLSLCHTGVTKTNKKFEVLALGVFNALSKSSA
jgi:hypothetical protein